MANKQFKQQLDRIEAQIAHEEKQFDLKMKALRGIRENLQEVVYGHSRPYSFQPDPVLALPTPSSPALLPSDY